ncbi:MAG: hypothetical protein M3P87_10545 [Actinomycetota bacterium]|nr:hypothetical protein [Actinomycetota bacterium]
MATTARLSAFLASILALALVLSIPTAKGSGLGALVGGIGALLLVAGLIYGVSASITAAAVAFVLQLAIVSALPVALSPPFWAQALLIVLIVEFATASFTARSRQVDPILMVVRSVGTAVTVGGVVQVSSLLLEGSAMSGVLVRAVGLAALIVAGGWVTLIWRRSSAGASASRW